MPANIYYLPIRSFGDFVIMASVVKFNATEKVPIVLPEYFNELFSAIEGERYFEVANTISLDNQPTFFELYKVKTWHMIKKLLFDYRNLSRQLDKKATYLLDFSSKRIAFLGPNFVWPSAIINIYDAKQQMLAQNLQFKPVAESSAITPPGKIGKVVIFPDSRVADKAIPQALLNLIIKAFPQKEIVVAKFSPTKTNQQHVVNYSNFNELISLIKDCDLVISSESLPYHLAHYYSKPHFVIYKVSKHFNKNFMTASMIATGYYAIYNGNNDTEVLEKLTEVITN